MLDITVVTVSWHSAGHIENLLRNLRSKASDPEAFKTIVIDNTNGDDASLNRLAEQNRGRVSIHPLDTKDRVGGFAHGDGLNYAMGLLDTEYAVVVDPDIYVFKTGWDRFCIQEMGRTGSIAIGAPYPKWKVGKFHDFPSPPFCFFHVKSLLDMCGDWTAEARHWLGDLFDLVVRQVGRLGGLVTRRRYERSELIRKYSVLSERLLGVYSPDAGWRIARAAGRSGAKSVLFREVLPEDSELAPREAVEAFVELADQYELFYHGRAPFVTHKYSSSARPWRTARSDDEQHWWACIEQLEAAAAGSAVE